MAPDRAPRTQRFACLALAICVAWTGMVAPAPGRDGSIAFAAPRVKKVAEVHPRLAGAADAAHGAKGAKRLKVSAKPAKRSGLAAAAKLPAGAQRLFQPDAEPLADGPIVVNGKGYLPSPVYSQLRNDAEAILTKLPPDQYFYIGVGRSPTAVITFLSLVVPGGAVAFPASGLSNGIPQHRVAEFNRHIEALIPLEAFTSGKTIVLMDTVSGGGSLRAMRDRLSDYSLRKHRKHVTIDLLGLGGTADGITHVVNSKGFLQAGKDDIAPYIGEHHIGRDTLAKLPGKQNPRHADFRSALAQRMMRDRGLDDFIVATRALARTTVSRRMTPSGPPVAMPLSTTAMTPGDVAKAKDAILSLLGPHAWEAAPDATLRLALTPAAASAADADAHPIAISANIHPRWVARLSDPQALKPFAPLIGGPALPHALQIDVTLDKKGRVAGRAAVAITRQDLSVSPEEFPGKLREFTFPHDRYARLPRAKATAATRKLLTAMLGNVVVSGGKPQTAHVKWRPAREFAPQAIALTSMPPRLQVLFESGEIPTLLDMMAKGGDPDSPRDVDIEIRFGADGKLAGSDAIAITFPLREVTLHKEMVHHQELRYQSFAPYSIRESLAEVRGGLATNLYDTRVHGAAGPVVIEVTKVAHMSGAKLVIDSNLPTGSLEAIFTTWSSALSVLVDGMRNLHDAHGGLPLTRVLRIEIAVGEDGQLKLDDSMRLSRSPATTSD